ncbi:MAG: LysR family transcriptional regulator [Acidimicrobiales bacterium]
MELRQLNALLGVVDHGGFSAAADALRTVQSNVSAHVAHLERELGTTLIDRGTARLTEAGEAVAARARRINAELEAIVADVIALGHQVTGTVRIGMIGTTARWLVPRLLDLMSERHPLVHLVVVDGNSTTLEPQLSAGRLDMAVVNLPVPESEFSTFRLFDEDLVLAIDGTHRLAQAASVSVADLADIELLLPLGGTAFRDELDRATQAQGITLRSKAELDGVRLIASLTLEGHGPAILPATAIPESLRDRWRLIPVAGLPRRRVGVAQRSRALASAPARALLELLAEVALDSAGVPSGLHPPDAP